MLSEQCWWYVRVKGNKNRLNRIILYRCMLLPFQSPCIYTPHTHTHTTDSKELNASELEMSTYDHGTKTAEVATIENSVYMTTTEIETIENAVYMTAW